MSRESKILVGVLVGVVAVMVGLFVLANQGADKPAAVGDKKIIRDSSHKQGSGPVQVVEFGDYQCPACGAAYPNVKQLQKDFEGKFTFYFRNFPLTQLHQNAQVASVAAETAANEGKFWEMHDKLYETQKDWETLSSGDVINKFTEYAGGLGLDKDKFKKALTDNQFKTIVDQDAADATALGVNATPTFYFDGKQHSGSNTYESLRDALNAALAAKQPAASATPTPEAPVEATPAQ